jgi:hypothetical protein
MGIVDVGIGFMLLIAGRPAYWVFTGGIAFLIGTFTAARLPLFSSQWNALILSLLFAVFGVVLAFLAHRWAARLAGFVAGGFLLYNMPVALGAQADWVSPLLFALAGLVAFGLLMVTFDFALALISSLTGTTLILRSFQIGTLDQGVMFIILTVFGLITQYLILQYGRPSPD